VEDLPSFSNSGLSSGTGGSVRVVDTLEAVGDRVCLVESARVRSIEFGRNWFDALEDVGDAEEPSSSMWARRSRL
jgi:hypothetical protein